MPDTHHRIVLWAQSGNTCVKGIQKDPRLQTNTHTTTSIQHTFLMYSHIKMFKADVQIVVCLMLMKVPSHPGRGNSMCSIMGHWRDWAYNQVSIYSEIFNLGEGICSTYKILIWSL